MAYETWWKGEREREKWWIDKLSVVRKVLGSIRGTKEDRDVSRDASDPVSTRSRRVSDSDARRFVAKRPRHDELTFPGHGIRASVRHSQLCRGNFNARYQNERNSREICVCLEMELK